ncbi:MAG TPA: ACT domain-containing protein [Candidatus Obscuribacterales bacterium]
MPKPAAVTADLKLIRILKVRLEDKPGQLGNVATMLGELGVNIGEISIVAQGPDYIIREISVQLQDEEHLIQVRQGIDSLDGVTLDDVIDPVQQIHEGGKIEMRSRVQVDTIAEMRKIYTPGVAQICKLIQRDASQSKRYTGIGNTVAIVTNGTAVLGLGNIGPVAGMPVMEGKAVLFGELVGISAIPILVKATDVNSVVQTIKEIAPTFGAIQLEDIAAPECFDIEERLIRELPMPVLHDDQHATGVVVLAALLTIAQRVRVQLSTCKIGIIGLGAAGMGIAKLLMAYGVKQILGTDLRKEAMKRLEQSGGKSIDLAGIMAESDIVVATSGKPGLIKPEMVKPGQVILALSNPDPEILPEVALKAGARFAADGRTINNALAFPGLFRGALKAGASRFTDKMKIASAAAISSQTKPDVLVPSILDRHLHQVVASAVEQAWFA